MRPASIITFERLYLVATGLGLINSLMSLDRLKALVGADPVFRTLGMGESLVFAMIALGVAIPLLLWFLIAQKASVMAKWLLVAVEALRLTALSFLFRADAKAWLAAGGKRTNAQG